MRFWDGDYRDE